MIALLFVCLGNICRSPSLMGYMRVLIKKRGLEESVYVDSCALYPSFLGASPDERMAKGALLRGVNFDHEAKLFESAFFEAFDAIFGVTEEIVSHLRSLAHTKEEKEKIYLATEFSQKFQGIDIPDPYYLGAQGFEKIWEIIEDACLGIEKEFIPK